MSLTAPPVAFPPPLSLWPVGSFAAMDTSQPPYALALVGFLSYARCVQLDCGGGGVEEAGREDLDVKWRDVPLHPGCSRLTTPDRVYAASAFEIRSTWAGEGSPAAT